MFKTTINCPTPSNKGNDICPGTRINGTLKCDCAICPKYKKYVKESFPEGSKN